MQLVTVVGFGIASVAAIVIGKTIGQGEIKAAEVYGKYLMRMTVLVSLIGAGLVLAMRPLMLAQMEMTAQAKGYLSIHRMSKEAAAKLPGYIPKPFFLLIPPGNQASHYNVAATAKIAVIIVDNK